MNELALFAGAGGGILGGVLLGWRTVCAVERDAYAASILAQRQNDGILPIFPIWSDITSFDGRPWRRFVDVVSAGFPCPAFSRAARGRNLEEKDLWYEAARIVDEVRPTFFLGENVSRQAIEQAASDLNDMGYICRGIKIAASDLGADHIRERYWILAYPNDYGKLRGLVNAKTPVLPQLRSSVWETFSDEPRVVDGVADRVDRNKAIGNGQVPAVAALAWEILIA